MFNILLFLLGVVTVETNKKHLLCNAPKLEVFYEMCVVTVETNKKHLLCNTPKLEAFYEMCDDSFTPIIKLESCELSKNTAVNFSVITIPRKNIDRLYATVKIWKGPLSVSDRTYVLCSGIDDEFDFCGTLKGETLNINLYNLKLKNLQLYKDLYTMKIELFVGEKEELLLCFLLAFNIKYTIMI